MDQHVDVGGIRLVILRRDGPDGRRHGSGAVEIEVPPVRPLLSFLFSSSPYT